MLNFMKYNTENPITSSGLKPEGWDIHFDPHNVTQVGKKNELLQDSFFREVQFSLRKRM